MRVVPTSGIVEGFAALLEYDPESGADDNAAAMAESARRVVAGEVTRSVRDAQGPFGTIAQGDWMGHVARRHRGRDASPSTRPASGCSDKLCSDATSS